jgi:tetratricopeptide (TPR) repeat protein
VLLRFAPTGLAAILVLAVLFSGPSYGGITESDRHYSRGRELATSGDTEEATREFERAVAENPQNPEAHYQLGLLYSRSISGHEKAETEFLILPDIAMRAGGKTRDDLLFRAGLALAKLYIKMGRLGIAVPLVKNILASAPVGAPLDDAYNALGLGLYYERLYDEAIFELRRAIKHNPDNLDAKFNLKTIRTRLEHFQAGKLYSRMGDRKGSISEYRKAIGLDPRFVEARHRLGVELLLSGDHAEAFKELKRAEVVSPSYRKAYEIWYAEGIALVRLARTREALVQFGRVAEVRPNFAAVHNEIGKVHFQRGEYDEAITAFARAIGLDARTEYAKNLVLCVTKKGTPPAIPPIRP